jgi:uncharacterized protein (DUF2235 family)
VLKLFRIIQKNEDQIVFYSPGAGTISTSDPWSRFKTKVRSVLGLLTGYGLDNDVLNAYYFLIDNYAEGDHIYLFGFSRGAYTIRVLAGFLLLMGLLQPDQRNLAGYALTIFKRNAAQKHLDFIGNLRNLPMFLSFAAAGLDAAPTLGMRFRQIIPTRLVMIKFLGVWDTVSSMIVPRPDRLYLPSTEELAFTRTNSSVEVFRQAIAIDERRRMFRLYQWDEPQTHTSHYFDSIAEGSPQDIKQVWFAGVHADIGGGYPEGESGPAKYPLGWLIGEAVTHGLLIDQRRYDSLVFGAGLFDGIRDQGVGIMPGPFHTPPSVTEKIRNSMTPVWILLELLPKRAKHREWRSHSSLFGMYLPLCEPRRIDDGARVHHSVFARVDNDPDYRPPNLPTRDRVQIEPPTEIEIRSEENLSRGGTL